MSLRVSGLIRQRQDHKLAVMHSTSFIGWCLDRLAEEGVSLSRKPSKNSVCVCVCVCVYVLRGAGSLLRRGREHGNPKGEGTPCGQIYGDVMSQQRVGIVGQRAAKGSSNLGSFRAVVVCFIYG